MTADRGVAEDLAQTALTRTSAHWDRLAGADLVSPTATPQSLTTQLVQSTNC